MITSVAGQGGNASDSPGGAGGSTFSEDALVGGGFSNRIFTMGGNGGMGSGFSNTSGGMGGKGITNRTVICNGNTNIIDARGGTGGNASNTVGGAGGNASISEAFIGCGRNNSMQATAGSGANGGMGVGGNAIIDFSVIGGGRQNVLLAQAAPGDGFNMGGMANINTSFIGEGQFNLIRATAFKNISALSVGSSIVGGHLNIIEAISQENMPADTSYAAIGGGQDNKISAIAHHAVIPGGQGLILNQPHTSAVGKYNLPGIFSPGVAFQPTEMGNNPVNTSGGVRVFMVGYGEDDNNRQNLMSVTEDGVIHAKTGFSAMGADYAEWFESFDGKPIAIGSTVDFVPGTDKIRIASQGDRPFGVVSNNASVVANSAEEYWNGRFIKDIDGNLLMKSYDETYETQILNPEIDKVIKNNIKSVSLLSNIQRNLQKETSLSPLKILEKMISEKVTQLVQKKELTKMMSTVLRQEEIDMINSYHDTLESDLKKILYNLQKRINAVLKIHNPKASSKIDVEKLKNVLDEIKMIDEFDLTIKVKRNRTSYHPKVSSFYDPSRPYIPRSRRPEWHKIGLIGQVKILKKQTTSQNWRLIKSLNEKYDLWLIK